MDLIRESPHYRAELALVALDPQPDPRLGGRRERWTPPGPADPGEAALRAQPQTGEVVGFVMASGAELLDGLGTSHRVLTLSPLAVAPHRQGAGVGGAGPGRLLPTGPVPPPTLGESPLYPRFGFRPAGRSA